MRTISVKIYKFSELSNGAKEKAKAKYKALFGYLDSDAALASLKAVVKHFDGKLADYSIDWFDGQPSYANFDMPNPPREEIENKLSELGDYNPETYQGLGDCKLTGWCFDEYPLDQMREELLTGVTINLTALMQAGFRRWLKLCQDDANSFYEDENFAEHCNANGYEFYADGRIVGRSN